MSDRDTNQQQMNQPNQDIEKASNILDSSVAMYAKMAAEAFAVKKSAHYLLRSKALGHITTRTAKFLSYMDTHGSRKDIEDMSFKEMRNYMTSMKEALKHSKENMDELKFRDGNRTLFGVLKRETQLEGEAKRRAKDMFRKNSLIPEMQEMIREKNLTQSEEQHFYAFIERVSRDPHDLMEFRRAKESHIGDKDSAFADEMLGIMQKRMDEASKKQGKIDQIASRLRAGLRDAHRKQIETIEGLERTFGTASRTNRADSFLDHLVGNRAGTMRDLLKLIKQGKVKDSRLNPGDKTSSMIEEVKKLDAEFRSRGEKEYQRFLNILPDESGFRIGRNGKAFVNQDISHLQQDILNSAANTLPGQILKLRELENETRLPSLNIVAAGANDPYLHASLKAIKKEGSDVIQYANGDIYALNEKGEAEYLTPQLQEKGIELEIVSGKHGFWHSLISTTTGQSKIRDVKNPILRFFEIGTDGEKYQGSRWNRLKTVVTKFNDPNFRGNIAENMRHPDATHKDAFDEIFLSAPSFSETKKVTLDTGEIIDLPPEETRGEKALRTYLGDAAKMRKIMDENSHTMTPEMLRALKETIPTQNKRTRKLLDLLLSGKSGEEMIETMFEDQKLRIDDLQQSPFLSEELRSVYIRTGRNVQDARNVLNQATDRTKLSIGSSLLDLVESKYNNEHLDLDAVAKKTIEQELLLSIGQRGSKEEGVWVDYNAVNKAVGKAAKLLDNGDAEELDNLAQYSVYSHYVSPRQLGKTNNYSDQQGYAIRVNKIYTGDEEWQKHYQESFDRIIKDEISSLEQAAPEDQDSFASRPLEDFVSVRKAIGVEDIIGNLNNLTKAKAEAKAYAKQFIADGVTSPEDVTQATLTPLFFLKRMSDDLNSAAGLGLDGSSFTSLPRTLRDITLKRILPVALAYEYGDWADDTSQELTGTSITGAAANGIANVDLAVRKTVSAFGMDDWLKEEKAINPIWQYWFGHDDYQGYNERRKYYESGYTPVRKGAWWTFGGVGEARGGEIQYWEPSFVRRINSDYKDKALYDGYWDKWSHSWLPTPTNPLSPLFAFMDPYHLEEEHEDDRPYALSGPLFQEGTPWGAILNPTLGKILKPEKELHPYRFRNGVDAKGLIHEINLSIQQAARNLTDTNDILINGNSFMPVDYNNYNAPTEDTKVLSYQIGQSGIGSISAGVYGAPSGGAGTGGTAGSGGNGAGAWGIGGFAQNLMNGYNELQPTEVGAKELLRVDEHNRLGFREALRDVIFSSADNPPVHDGDLIANSKGQAGVYSQRPRGANDLSLQEKLAVGKYVNDGVVGEAEGAILDVVQRLDPKAIISGVNDQIKAQAASKADTPYAVDAEDGFTSNLKLSSFRPSQAMELLKDPDSVADLVNAGKGSDFVRDVTSSWRLIGGIYGYAGAEAMGIGVYEDKRLARSSDMDSYNRGFWDENLGGLGGNVADIIHRFIPDFKRMQRVNPLMNNMPDWLPERFRFGDPYTIIPKGEMRLPGKGYESLNKLHPDQYGNYGAYDRMKILADIAPFSPEYKMWKQIAAKTVTDPELIEDMDNIRQRVAQQGKKHDFYNYKILGQGLNYENVEVSEVLGYGRFRSGQKIYKIAGISVKSSPGLSMQETLGKYLKPGMDITIATDKNDSYNINKDSARSINAAVYIDGENLANEMLEAGDAQKRKGDTSAPAILGNMSTFQILLGGASEFVAHMDIPWISDQFLRVRSPYESYKAEQVYGTPYQSWDHPISTFFMPALERSIYQRDALDNALNVLYRAAVNNNAFGTLGKDTRHAIQAAHFLGNRASFMGAAMANLISMRNAKLTDKFDKKMNTIVTAGHFLTGGNSYTDEMSSGAMIGYDIAQKLEEDLLDKAKALGKEEPKGIRGKGALIGAAVGASYRLLFGPKGNGQYIPERTKKKWDTEDYFDRLTYLKYMGLYEQAARMAEKEDGVDIKSVIQAAEHRQQMNQARIKKYQKLKQELTLANDGETSPEKQELSKILTQKINALANEPAKLVDGSKWALSALVYKNAAEATMQGLKTSSSWSQIVTALPTNDREYFMEFVKERDEDKRRKIMRISSPALQKALMLAWGKVKKDKTDSEKIAENKQYFKHHYLPSADWAGWTPNLDLKNVEVKTIANEGENLSDFGFYESELRDPNTAAAPALNYSRRNSTGNVSRDIKRILQGKGLRNVNVDVTESSTLSASQIKADFKTYTSGRQKQKMLNRSLAGQNQTNAQ